MHKAMSFRCVFMQLCGHSLATVVSRTSWHRSLGTCRLDSEGWKSLHPCVLSALIRLAIVSVFSASSQRKAIKIHPLALSCRHVTWEPLNEFSWYIALGCSLKFVNTFPIWLSSYSNEEQFAWRPTFGCARMSKVIGGTRYIFIGLKIFTNDSCR
jgi:hypothetical protein